MFNIFISYQASFDRSPISEIFRGQIRNILNRQGVKESATLQPFFTLQLEIQVIEVQMCIVLFIP